MKSLSNAAFQVFGVQKAKYILQKTTLKIKQLVIQLAINQLFQKLKRRSTNRHDINIYYKNQHLKLNSQLFN
jgi:hypothetical protein